MSLYAAECDEVVACALYLDNLAEGNDRARVAANVTILMLIMEHAAMVITTTTTITLIFLPEALACSFTALHGSCKHTLICSA